MRIRSLRFQDGTVMFNPDTSDFGAVTFDIQGLPDTLANPQPAFFIDRERDALLRMPRRDPDIEVVRAMPRRRVHEARTRIVRDVIASQ